MTGKVIIIGAGPGAADLLTVRAASTLQSAEVVLHDDLVPAEILQLVPHSAQIMNVGKRCGDRSNSQEKINALMIWHAHNGNYVVRLKSGDPAIFARLGEEMDALRRAGIPFEIVPGITAASAAAAAAEITLTDRRAASTLVMATAHSCSPETASPGAQRRRSKTTLAIYMPGPDYAQTAQQLVDSGLDANTPCVLVSNAGRPAQQVCYTTISDLPFAIGIAAPAVLLVGEVARLRGGTEEISVLKTLMEENYEPVGDRGKNPAY